MKSKKTKQNVSKAEDIQKKSLETFGETMKQKLIENDEKQSTSKSRNTGSENAEVFARENKVINRNPAARDRIKKRKNEKQIRKSQKSNAL